MHRIINGDCLNALRFIRAQCVFADPPDNIGLDYRDLDDWMPEADYRSFLELLIYRCADCAPIVWLSFNAKWTAMMGSLIDSFLRNCDEWEFKPCVQTFTFGQHNSRDLGNNHRPLWRLSQIGSPRYPSSIKVPSWREQNGDKRASPGGRVPGDVFDFPRVTGNSKQRRRWHPTQLHEGLVERCIKLSTREGDHVIDPFGGTGTTLRVCKRIGRSCTLIERSSFYCQQIASEHELEIGASN